MELSFEFVKFSFESYYHYRVQSINFSLHLIHGVLKHFHMNLGLDVHLHMTLIIHLLLFVLDAAFALQLYDFLVQVSNYIFSLNYSEINRFDLICYECVIRVFDVLYILAQSTNMHRKLLEILLKYSNLCENRRLLCLFTRFKEIELALQA